MNNLKISLFKRSDDYKFVIFKKDYILKGIFQNILYTRTNKNTKIHTMAAKGLLSWDIPAFGLN